MGQSWTNKARKLGMLCAVNLSLYLNCFAGVDQGEKKVTLNVVEENCVKVFKQIEKQTKMSFFYSTSDIRLPGKVSISVVNAALDEVMGRILEGTNLEWIYTDNVITIRKKKGLVGGGNGLGSVADSNINMITVTGKVTDADGTGIPGATVRVKRTGDGVTTDGEGEFSLPKTRKNDLLTISSIGYETREIPISENKILIKLNIVVNDLDETVIKGYYTTTRRLNTGSVIKITSEEIEKQPTITDPILALQGSVPGLQVSQSSGVPGAVLNVQLRGQNSIQNGNAPLYIVDGVPFTSTTLTNSAAGAATALSPFANISLSTIESIEILKDADATAIYGSRGANGVILITTKKAKPGKTSVTGDIFTALGRVTKKLDLLDTKQYLEMRHEALLNDNSQISSEDHDINGKWDSTRYTDWQKEFIGGTSNILQGQINVSGGSSNTQFISGLSYRKETTVFPGDFSDKKYSAYLNLSNTSLDNKFKIIIGALYSNDNNTIPTVDLTSNIFLAPNAPTLYDNEGNLNWADDTWINPIAITKRSASSITSNLIGSANLRYTIMKNLTISSNVGYNSIQMDQSIKTPITSVSPSSATNTRRRRHLFATNSIKTWNFEPQLDFSKEIADGKLSILVGTTFQEIANNSLAQNAIGFPTDILIDNLDAAETISVINTNYSQYRYSAIFGRINYDWRNTYILNITARRDGSSRFGPRKRFGNFGAVGAAWIFSNEKFFQKNVPLISFGKIRASYGTTGNDQFADYQYMSTYSSYSESYLGLSGLYPSRIANPYFSWEVVKKIELGIELGLIKDKIMLNANFYRNRTSNQLVGYSLPTITGFNTIQANLPALIENKGLEFEIKANVINNNIFSWLSSLNLTRPINKLIAYPNLESSSYASSYEVGKSLFISKRYHSLGVNPQTGIYEFLDVNKDGIMSFSQDRLALKERSAKIFGGLRNTFSYKGFQLDILVQFVKQTGLILPAYGYPGAFNLNQPVAVMNRWRLPGDNTAIQMFSASSSSPAGIASDLNSSSDSQIGDASFIRFKTIYLSYTLPVLLTRKLKIQNSKIYLQGQNLATITSYKGLDPEVQGMAILPPLKVLTVGVQIVF